jgi:two-component system OmpR family response regulator
MVVEDDPDISKALAAYAERRGFEVVTADNGHMAVEVGTTHRPDVILLDIALPGMDGRDVMVKLNEAGVTERAVVIFVTARDSQTDRIVGLELGADDYETKPLHFHLLFQKIDRLLEKKHGTEI